MPEPVTPTICLNMIVKNEAHIVTEVLDATAPYISSWVIVDTGSTDGTQDLIRSHMKSLGIPGELHERPWVDFGHNRTEAVTLAQGHADYIWVMDADDTVTGTPDFTDLSADVYSLRIAEGTLMSFWRTQLFRDGLPVRYVGVLHEYAAWDGGHIAVRLDGDYHVEARHLGGRNLDPRKLEYDRDLLLAEIERNPDDARSVGYLAQTYCSMGDFENGLKWFAHQVKMGGEPEAIYYAMWRVADCMRNLDRPFENVRNAYLVAWKMRPTRAEPLLAIALLYRARQQYPLAYEFARRAAATPLPTNDSLIVITEIYTFRATLEQAVCAFAIGKKDEAITLCGQLLARIDIPDDDRQKVINLRELSSR